MIVLPWEELSTNQELHKGVEFGVKAAGEVSKDKEVGGHAPSASDGLASPPKAASRARARCPRWRAGRWRRQPGPG